MTAPTSATVQDRLLRLVIIGTAIATLAVATVGVLTLTRANTAADNTDRVAQGNELAACRSLARAPLDQARTEMEALILVGLAAAAHGNDQALADVSAGASSVVGRLEAAQADLTAALEQSITDPAAFVADCTGGTP